MKVAGKCPMGCGETLILGNGGHVTCSWVECSNPTAADAVLGAQPSDPGGCSQRCVVTSLYPDGTAEAAVVPKDNYVITTGPDCQITHMQEYPTTRTVQLTIKRGRG